LWVVSRGMRPWAAGWLLAAAGAGCACGRKQTAAGARVRGCSGALYELLLTVVRAIRYRGTGYGPEYLLDGALPASTSTAVLPGGLVGLVRASRSIINTIA
jgi:hypothetical protein